MPPRGRPASSGPGQRPAGGLGRAAAGPGPGYYKVLGVGRQARAAEVKQAYMRLALRLHPDKYKGKDPAAAEERFKLVSIAYATLSDPETRKRYDISLPDDGEVLNTASAFSFS